jgi:hypothetical protein
MKRKSLILAGAFAAFGFPSAQAASVSYDVSTVTDLAAFGRTAGAGLDTGIVLAAGERFRVTADPNDTWQTYITPADPTRSENADGMVRSQRLTMFGQTLVMSSLVGKIGDGDFFQLGTVFDGFANAAGVLRLYVWERHAKDNAGDIRVTVQTAPVPLPASAPLLLAGLAAFAALRRRRRA